MAAATTKTTKTVRARTTTTRTAPPRPATIYDSPNPLTMFGAWSAWSMAVPLLGWPMVLGVALVFDAVHLHAAGGRHLHIPAGSLLSVAALAGVAALTIYLFAKMRHAPVTKFGPVVLAAVVLSTAKPLSHWALTIPLAAPWGVLAALVLAAGGWLLGSVPREHHHRAPAVYLAVFGAVAAAWVTWTVVDGVWHAAQWLVWFGDTLVFSLTWPATIHAQINHERRIKERRRSPQAAAEPTRPPRLTEQQKWALALEKAGAPGLHVYSVDPTKAGFALHVRLPDDGSITAARLDGLRDRMETVFGRILAASNGEGLRPGAIRIARARNKKRQLITHEVYVHIDVRDILAENLPLPDDHRPLSIYDAFTVGQFIDGEPIVLTLDHIHQMVCGQTRKGKSNYYHVLLSLLTRCYDAVVWMYDGKGGATVWPWVEPWRNGEIDPSTGEPLGWPVIDWVALDRLEFERILLAAVEAATARPGIRRQPEHAAADGGDEWKACGEYPAIFVICDELSESTGAHTGPGMSNANTGANSGELASLMTRGVVLGAGEKVLLTVAAQRGTIDMIGNGTAKSQLGGRIAFPLGGGNSEASEVFQGDVTATQMAAQLEHPGSCVMTGYGLDEAKPGKIFLVAEKPQLRAKIRQMVLAHTKLCGELDEATAAAIEKFGYSTRWTDQDRTYWLYNRPMPDTLLRYGSTPPPATNAPAGAGRSGSAVAQLGVDPVKYPSPFGAQANQPARPPAPDDLDWEQLEREHAATLDELSAATAHLVEQMGPPPAPAQPAPPPEPDPEPEPEPEGYELFVRLIRAAGPAGITVGEAHKQMGPKAPAAAKTAYTWRDKAIREGLITLPAGSSYNARLYAVEHWHRKAA